MPLAAFTTPAVLAPHPRLTRLQSAPARARRPRQPALHAPARLSLRDSAPDPPGLFVDDEEERAFWDDTDVSRALGPITEAEKAALREKLPGPVAQFLIRRAEAAAAQRDLPRGGDSFLGRLLSDLPPDVVDWEAEENEEYRGYVYETNVGPPAFRRKGSSLFGGGDGLGEVEDRSNVGVKEGEGRKGKGVMSLFVGNVGSVDEQASRVGYSLLVLAAAFVLLKIIIGVVSFFVSFTFSFLAIFALSAGIFVVFFFLRF